MIKYLKEKLFILVEYMAKRNCEAGFHCKHQYSNYKCCCWCRKVFPDN